MVTIVNNTVFKSHHRDWGGTSLLFCYTGSSYLAHYIKYNFILAHHNLVLFLPFYLYFLKLTTSLFRFYATSALLVVPEIKNVIPPKVITLSNGN